MNPLDHFLKSDKIRKDKDKMREVLDKDLFSNNNIGTTLKSVFAPTPQVAQQRKEAVTTFIKNIATPIQTTRSDMVGSAQALGRVAAISQPKVTGATVRTFDVPLPKPTVAPKMMPLPPQPKVYRAREVPAIPASKSTSMSSASWSPSMGRLETGQGTLRRGFTTRDESLIPRDSAGNYAPGQRQDMVGTIGLVTGKAIATLPTKERAEVINGITAGILKGAGAGAAGILRPSPSPKPWMDPPGVKHPTAPNPLVPLPTVIPGPKPIQKGIPLPLTPRSPPPKAVPLPWTPNSPRPKAVPLPVIIGRDYGGAKPLTALGIMREYEKAKPLSSGLGIIGGKL